MLTAVKAAMKRRRSYNGIVKELGSLDERELRDLGISRSDVHRVAHDTVYGR